MEGVVEVDETFVGGKNKNRHKDKKVQNSQGRSFKDKEPILGMIQRSEFDVIERPHKIIPSKVVEEKIIHKASKITAFAIMNTRREVIQPIVYKYVKYRYSIDVR